VTTRTELETLTSKELHDRAFARAERRLDLRFFYNLTESLPAAAAVSGDTIRSNSDIFAVRGLMNDIMGSGEGELAETLRPVYIEYLVKHGG
jgi:hypothetical protein